jgi:hypothetical protein
MGTIEQELSSKDRYLTNLKIKLEEYQVALGDDSAERLSRLTMSCLKQHNANLESELNHSSASGAVGDAGHATKTERKSANWNRC